MEALTRCRCDHERQAECSGGGLPGSTAGCSCPCHWSTAETRAGLEAWERARAGVALAGEAVVVSPPCPECDRLRARLRELESRVRSTLDDIDGALRDASRKVGA